MIETLIHNGRVSVNHEKARWVPVTTVAMGHSDIPDVLQLHREAEDPALGVHHDHRGDAERGGDQEPDQGGVRQEAQGGDQEHRPPLQLLRGRDEAHHPGHLR